MIVIHISRKRFWHEKGTLEEKILKLQESKKDLADSIVKDEMKGFQSLTQDALLKLLEA